jgi:hypothetical protein
MLTHFVRTLLVAATLTAGGAAVAKAAGPRSGPDIVFAEHHRDRGDRWERRGEGRWDRGDSHHGFVGGRDLCSPRHALRKAARMGVRGGDIVRDSRRAVVVAGFKRGHPILVRFAQERGCPFIGVR